MTYNTIPPPRLENQHQRLPDQPMGIVRQQNCVLEMVGSNTEASLGSDPSPFLFTLRLPGPHQLLPSTEVLGWFLYCQKHQHWRWVRVQRTSGGLCLGVQGEQPAAQHQPDGRTGSGIMAPQPLLGKPLHHCFWVGLLVASGSGPHLETTVEF